MANNRLTFKILNRVYFVDSLTEARDMWVRVRDTKDFGFSRQAETIVSRGGKPVARISYNGRVWTPGDWQTAKEIAVD